MKMPASLAYEYPRPALTVDCVVFGYDGADLKVLLVRRGLDPFKGKWALPGGFVRVGESVDDAARRELREETGLGDVFLEQLYTFGEPRRDPRERVVSVAYYALVALAARKPSASTDADEAGWFSVADVPGLAFDHAEILACALIRLRGKIRYELIGFELLPAKFPLTALQQVYETILGRSLDKRNFRKKLMSMGIVKDTGRIERGVAHRAARLYRFDKPACKRLKKAGFNFEM